MELIYFSRKGNFPEGKGLYEKIRQEIPDLKVRIFTDCQSLKQWLQVPPRTFLAAIIELHDHGTLINLATFHELFADRRVVFAVPDFSYQPLVYAHKFSPLLLVSTTDGYKGVIASVKKWFKEANETEDWV